jgi:hypothetical protein
MSDNNNSGGGGVGIGTVLAVVFTVLKLCGVIAWPWIWVLSPLWIGFCLAIFLVALGWVLKH